MARNRMPKVRHRHRRLPGALAVVVLLAAACTQGFAQDAAAAAAAAVPAATPQSGAAAPAAGAANPAAGGQAAVAASAPGAGATPVTTATPSAAAATAAASTPAGGAATTTTAVAAVPAATPAEAAGAAARPATATPVAAAGAAATPAAAAGAAATPAAATPAAAAGAAATPAAATPAAAAGAAATPAAAAGAAATPAAAATNATADLDDISLAGACKDAIASLCPDVEAGNGAVADCLTDVARDADVSSEEGAPPPLSDACHEEVLQFKISRDTSIKHNPTLAKACVSEIASFCNITWYSGAHNGSVISCLRGVSGDKLGASCRREVFKLLQDASYDLRADSVLAAACMPDAEKLCKGIKHGGGRVQACLRDQRLKLNWDCEAELYRQEREDAGDMRLSSRLFRACLADKRSLCPDVPPGHAAAKQCLEDAREELGPACRAEVDGMIERRVRDFRLDSRLRKACESDIYDTCAYLGGLDSMDPYHSTIISCLQDFKDELKSDACRTHVTKYMELAAQDVRFDVPLADACAQDRAAHCANVPPGSARVIRCLQSNRDKLTVNCRATLLQEEVKFSENIDFQYPMKQACLKEIDRFCKDVPHGNARVIRCLQDKKDHKDFGTSCRHEVMRYERESAVDYRLNFRLAKACKADVGQLCAKACDVRLGQLCGGKVLSCLTESKASLRSDACRKEVAYLERMEVQDFRTDMALAEACRADVDKLCAKVEPGEGRVHKCLRDNAAQLSAACRREEMRLEEKEAENVQLNAGLLRACAGERSLFCRGVQPGSARVFRCLAENMASADFGGACKNVIMQKLRRREANWRLDPPLRKACKADVDRLCSAEDARRGEDGSVKKCLVARNADLSQGCQRELGRSLHMSFFVWQPKGLLTAPCDADIQALCLSKTRGMEVTPGAVGVCLAEIVEHMAAEPANRRRSLQAASDAAPKQQQQQQSRKAQPGGNVAAKQQAAQAVAPQSQPRVSPALGDACYALASLAAPPSPAKGFDVPGAAYAALTKSMAKLQDMTGLPTVSQQPGGGMGAISLTGWTALAGIAALVLVLLAGATVGVRQYLGGGHDGYTLVMKAAPGGR